MKKVLVICISILCFTLLAQDIDKLKQSNKTLTDSLLVLNSKFNKRVEKLNDELLVLQNSKLQIQTKLTRQEQLKSEAEKIINNYQITLNNKFMYDILESLDIYIVTNEKGENKINKLRKHLINSNTIKSSDSLLFTNEFIYSFELDQLGRISTLFKLTNTKEIIQSIQSTKKYLKKANNKNEILQRLTGVNQGFLSLINDISLIQDSMRRFNSEIEKLKLREDSISTFVLKLTSYVDDVNNSFKYIIENNTIKINRTEKVNKDVVKNILKYPTTRFGKVDLCLQPLYETTLNDGTPLQQALTPEHWERLIDSKTPAFRYKDFDSINKKDVFYNEYAIVSSKLAPVGYHVLNIYDYELLKNKVIWHKSKEKVDCWCNNGYETIDKYTTCSNCDYWTKSQKLSNYCSVCRNRGHFVTTLGKKVCSQCKGKTFYYSEAYGFDKELMFQMYRTLNISMVDNYNVLSRKNDGTLESIYSSDDVEQILICKNQPYKENPNYSYIKIDGLSYVDHLLKKNRFNNGELIKKVTDPHIDPIEWEIAQMKKEPRYYIPTEDSLIGYMYNSFAISDTRGLIPPGLIDVSSNYIYRSSNVRDEFNSKIENEKFRFDRNFYTESKYGRFMMCLNETIDYNPGLEDKNEYITEQKHIPFKDIDDINSFFKSGSELGSGSSSGRGSDSGFGDDEGYSGSGGKGTGSGQTRREPRQRLSDPTPVESNYSGTVVLMLIINAEGTVVKAINLNGESTITDARIINQYISNVKSSVRYNKMPGTKPQVQKLTINVKAS